MSLADHARRYAEMRWALVALEGKTPLGHGWQRALPLDPDDAADIWSRRSSNNMGLVLGPSGVLDFELDGGDRDLYWELAGIAGKNTPHFVTGSGKPHLLFWDKNGLSRKTRDGLELRAGPHQSVIPPSIHPDTGKPYEWVRSPWEFTLQNPPQALLDFFAEEKGGRNEGNWREALRGEKLGKGQGRHQSLMSYMGLAVNQFADFDQFVAASIAFAAVTQDPPYDDEEIAKWAERVWDSYREEESTEETLEPLKIVRASSLEMRSVEFLWKPFVQRSAFHLLVGRKGAGKGSVLAWLAANVTQGADFGPPRSVLWISTEDSFEIDVKPRFLSQGGDEDLLLCVQQRVRLPRDIDALESACLDNNVGLLVIDPIVSTIGGASSNDEGSVIDAIGGLNQLADELDLAVFGVRHIGKNVERGMLESVLGSAAWVNTPRAVLGIAQDEEEKVVTMEILASNRVRSRDAFDFKLNQKSVRGLDEPVPHVVPKGESVQSMESVLQKAKGRESKVPQVKEWLIELMADGTPMTKHGVIDECMERFGVGMASITRACADLKEEGKLVWIPPAKDEHGKFAEGAKWYFRKP